MLERKQLKCQRSNLSTALSYLDFESDEIHGISGDIRDRSVCKRAAHDLAGRLLDGHGRVVVVVLDGKAVACGMDAAAAASAQERAVEHELLPLAQIVLVMLAVYRAVTLHMTAIRVEWSTGASLAQQMTGTDVLRLAYMPFKAQLSASCSFCRCLFLDRLTRQGHCTT